MSLAKYSCYEAIEAKGINRKPEHWNASRLRFAATLNPSKQEAKGLGEQEMVSFLPMEAIGEDGRLRLEYEKELGECLSGYTYFRDGDVCIAKITPCFENGKGAILRGLKGGLGFGTTELIVARPREEKVTAEFLDYLFRSQVFRSLGESEMYGAGGQKRVPDSFVRDFVALIPSTDEQKQVTNFLDRETAKIDALITEQQRLIELLQEKRQAVISHAVTKGLNPNAPMKDSGVEWLGEVPEHWEVIRLKYLTQGIDGVQMGPFGALLIDLESQDTGYKVYGQENVIKQNLELGSRWISKARFQELERYTLRIGDIAVTRKGSLGNALLIQSMPQPGIGDSDTIRIRCDEERLNPNLLASLLHEADYINQQLIQLKRGSVLPGLNTETIRGLVVAIPQLHEQEELLSSINAICEEIQGLASEATAAESLLKERRAALISAAVTGQIDVRGLATEEETA